jgi:hypothetical protein
LFLTFDEGVLYFYDVSESGGLFDGVEGFINNFHISLVVVYKFNFFLVVDYEFGKSLFEYGCRIVLDGIDLSCFDSTAPVEFGIFEFFIEFCESAVVVGFVFLILHF